MRKGQGERREGKVREREEEIMEGQGERGRRGERESERQIHREKEHRRERRCM